MSTDTGRPPQARWHGAAKVLGLVRSEPGITRAEAAQRLGMSSGGATDLLARMRQGRLVDESPAPARGRGRPTTVLGPHPDGPLVILVDLRPGDWRLAVAGLDGIPTVVADGGSQGHTAQSDVLDDVAAAVAATYRGRAARVRAVGVSVAGTVSGSRVVQFTPRGWRDVDLAVLTSRLPKRAPLPLLLGNDATLAGLAEARSGSARTAGTVLHLLIGVGLGGTLVVDGIPITGSRGAAGEYGHVPFGDPEFVCPCGARGCWDPTVDGRALARHRGDPPPADPVTYADDVLRRVPGDADARAAVDTVVASLGRGIAGLVNLHDPDVVTLGGLAVRLRHAAPEVLDRAYQDGLMTFRKTSAPEILDGVHGDDAPLFGAAAMAIDHVTTEAALADWTAGFV
jgi:predicted NBD/HSP70 family sugar kinase